jgi:hypothetical protein
LPVAVQTAVSASSGCSFSTRAASGFRSGISTIEILLWSGMQFGCSGSVARSSLRVTRTPFGYEET